MRIKYYIDLLRLKLARWYLCHHTRKALSEHQKFLDDLEKFEFNQDAKDVLKIFSTLPVAMMVAYCVLLHCAEPVSKNEKSTK